MTISWIFSTFFFLALLAGWGPNKISSLQLPTVICCSLEKDDDMVDEVENIKKAFTVSDTILSRVSESNSEFEFSQDPEVHHNAVMEREMIALTISRRCEDNDERSEATRSRRVEGERSEVRRSVKQRRSQSYSQHSREGQPYGFRWKYWGWRRGTLTNICRTRSVENLTGDHSNHIRATASKSSKESFPRKQYRWFILQKEFFKNDNINFFKVMF